MKQVDNSKEGVPGQGKCPLAGSVSPMAAKLCSPAGNSYYIFVVLMLVALSALGSFVNDMYSPALPGMCKFFGCAVPVAQLGLTMGMIGLGAGQMLLGPISDKIGRKPALIGATVLFIVAAAAGTFATNIHVFNISRLFQGLGASAGYFLAKTIPADVYGGRMLAKLMALVGAINGLAPAVAPVAGGVIADDLGWKAIFWILCGFALLVILLSLNMKESLPADKKAKGSLWKSFSGYPELLRNRAFMTHCLLKGFALGMLFAFISSAPFIAQTHYGLSQTNYGYCVGVISLIMGAGSIMSLKFKPYKKSAFTGALIMAVGVVGLMISLLLIENLWFYFGCMAVEMFGAGMIFATANTLAMNEGRTHAGEAAALIGVTGYIIGGTVSPLVGMGNFMHSTVLVSLVLTLLVVFFAWRSRRLPADLNQTVNKKVTFR
ncbi:MAG: multidrug effflux MFS transporter [Muribaculaceae bacterium]|nr:multidrug effflux MFS transporter [Muribaculaceae bacterium]